MSADDVVQFYFLLTVLPFGTATVSIASVQSPYPILFQLQSTFFFPSRLHFAFNIQQLMPLFYSLHVLSSLCFFRIALMSIQVFFLLFCSQPPRCSFYQQLYYLQLLCINILKVFILSFVSFFHYPCLFYSRT